MSGENENDQANNPSVTDAPAAGQPAAGPSGADTSEAPAPVAASTTSPGGESAPPAPAVVTSLEPARAPQRAYSVAAPKPVDGTRAGLTFVGGLATTDNAITAHAALELGCVVVDNRTGKAAFDCDAEGVAEKLAERAALANW